MHKVRTCNYLRIISKTSQKFMHTLVARIRIYAMFVVIYLFIVVISLWYLFYYRYERYLRRFPGPTPLPIIGSALDFLSGAKVLRSLLKYQRLYKGNFKVYIGLEPLLVLGEATHIEFILNSTTILKKSKQYNFLNNWLGTGLLTADAIKWKKNRRIITPAFHFQILEEYIDVFDSPINALCQALGNSVGKESTNIYQYVTLCTLDIICESAMGISVNAQGNAESEYVKSVKQLCRIIVDRSFSPIQQYDLPYYFTNNYKIEKKAVKVLHSYTESVIRSRKQELEKRTVSKTMGTDAKKKMAFLDLLLEYSTEGQLLTDDELRQEVNTFMFEGHDTVASAISFALYCIANHPDIQRKVHDELVAIFSDEPGRKTTHRDLQQMKYLELVIKESLRLYPSVPFYGRTLVNDVEFEGRILPKGITIIIFAYGIQRDPRIFTNPDKFDPDRFLLENAQERNTYSYIPFSAGPRNCIGQKFATLEMKSIISKILWNYELLPAVPEHKLELVAETVMKSANGVHVKLKKRA